MEENTICSSCGGTFPKDQLTFFDDHYFCGECLFTETEVCSHCGTRIYSGDNEGSHEHPLCRSCFESYYTNCNRCGVLIAERDAYYPDDESDEGYCASCHRYITEHYTEKILLDNICFLFGTNKTSLCQSFKSEYGITILNYIDQLKIEDAKKLLLEQKLSVTEISEQLGFNSIHYFCRYFKKHTGLSPKEYQDIVL